MINKFNRILFSESFLTPACFIVFLISILLRSTLDIGADTGVYLDLGKKIAQGGKYYYTFFESNFPISFYFYALQYQVSSILHINQIIMSEIVINLLGVLSVFWAAKILKRSTIYENKAHYNLIVFAYFCGFFLRGQAMEIGEFGTKTGLLLLALYPYISFSFERKFPFTKQELICRGILMGLIPCIKPHYLVIILFIEFHRFFQKKSLRFFIQTDKLVMYFIGALYLLLIIKFIPEFFEFIVPMWQKVYPVYGSYDIFLENTWRHLAARGMVFAFIFLIFSRLKFTANDKILALFFASVSLLLILENLGTVDQASIFYAVTTICFFKFVFDLFASEKFSILENKFIVISLIFLPIFDLEILPASIFGLGGFANIFWLLLPIYPFILAKKLDASQRKKFLSKKRILIAPVIYALLILLLLLALQKLGGWAHIALNLAAMFGVLFFFERKVYPQFSRNFSPFFVFVVTTSISCLLYTYLSAMITTIRHDDEYTFPNKLSDTVAYYSKIHAPQKDDGILMVSIWITHQFPLLNFMEKNNYQKFHVATFQADMGIAGSKLMFPIDDKDRILTLSYLFNDVKEQLKNPLIKVVFINNSTSVLHKPSRCLINTLEFYFMDPEFKKLFLQNFHFENHVIITHKVKVAEKIPFITGEKPSVFDAVKPTSEPIFQDFEVYVRNEKK